MSLRSWMVVVAVAISVGAAEAAEAEGGWKITTPIVTYWAGPPMSDAVAKQMADGGPIAGPPASPSRCGAFAPVLGQ